MKTVLTIAGSDCSGGAGIQADLKTIAAHGLYGMSVITALTAQNTLGVSDVMPVPAMFLKQQLDSVISDIRSTLSALIPPIATIGIATAARILFNSSFEVTFASCLGPVTNIAPTPR